MRSPPCLYDSTVVPRTHGDCDFARRDVAHKKGTWLFGRNALLLRKVDCDSDGALQKEEFVSYFLQVLVARRVFQELCPSCVIMLPQLSWDVPHRPYLQPSWPSNMRFAASWRSPSLGRIPHPG